MPRPYAVDLRERVLAAHERGEGSQRVLARRFGVSVGTVCGWLAALRKEGRRAPRPPGGGRRALRGTDPQVLAVLVAERDDLTLAEYGARFAERAGHKPSLPALCRALAALGLARKKRPCTPRSRSVPTS